MMPAKPASACAERENDGEEPGNPDTDHARHLGIVDAGADHGAQARALEHQPQRDDKRSRDEDHGQPIVWHRQRAEAQGVFEAGRHRDRDRVATPGDET